MTPSTGSPVISVIVAARDAASTIARTLRALAAQRGAPAFEVIVIDNGSNDETATIVAQAEPKVRLIKRMRGAGVSDARNDGVAESVGTVLAFTDADCEPTPGWLAAGMAALEKADLVQGPVRPSPDVQCGPFDRTVWVTVEGLYETSNLFVRRSYFEQVGGFEEMSGETGVLAPFGEDALFGWRARRLGARSAFHPDALVYHAVFPRGQRGFIAERARLRYFPALVALVPELRTYRFPGFFLTPRTKAFDAALVALIGVAVFRRRALALGALPYATMAWRDARWWGSRRRLAIAAVSLAADFAGALALVRGSLDARTIVL